MSKLLVASQFTDTNAQVFFIPDPCQRNLDSWKEKGVHIFRTGLQPCHIFALKAGAAKTPGVDSQQCFMFLVCRPDHSQPFIASNRPKQGIKLGLKLLIQATCDPNDDKMKDAFHQ